MSINGEKTQTYLEMAYEQELADVVREFSTEGGGNGDGGEGGGNRGSRGDKKVLYDDFVDMLVVASPRCDNSPLAYPKSMVGSDSH